MISHGNAWCILTSFCYRYIWCDQLPCSLTIYNFIYTKIVKEGESLGGFSYVQTLMTHLASTDSMCHQCLHVIKTSQPPSIHQFSRKQIEKRTWRRSPWELGYLFLIPMDYILTYHQGRYVTWESINYQPSLLSLSGCIISVVPTVTGSLTY